MSAPASARPRAESRFGPATVAWAQKNGMFFALVALIAFFSITASNFFTVQNLSVIGLHVATIGIMAVPGAMLILSGYIDMSVGSVMVLAVAVFGQLIAGGVPTLVAVAIALGVGAGWGVLNGYLIALRGLSPIVVTLAGLAGARGIAEVITQGQTVSGLGEDFAWLGRGAILGIRLPIWICLFVFAVGFYVWNVTPIGRHMTAIGADAAAASSLGIAVRRIPFLLYVASGLAAALAGLILAAQLDGASLSIGVNQELQVLTAILLGGIAFTGGRGSLLGVVSGVLFLGVLSNGLIILGVGAFYQDVALGAALLFAAALDYFYQRLDKLALRKESIDEEEETQ